VKSLPSGRSQEAFDKLYEAEEVQILRDSRIVITTCTNASQLELFFLYISFKVDQSNQAATTLD